MKRGEVWTVAAGGDFAGKPRPALIIQNDRFESTPTVAVCACTSDPTGAALMRPHIQPSVENGLKAPTRLMVDKITIVPRPRLGYRVGALSAEDMARVDEALLIFLGLAD